MEHSYGIPNLPPFLLITAYLGAVGAGLLYMRDRHPTHIYAIWLVFSFFFFVFLSMGLVAERNNAGLTELCGSYKEACTTIYDMLTNFEDEILLVIILIGATIIPQVFAYILSALSGAATAPQYLWTIQQAAAWSFIKFSAGLSGILIAQPIARFVVGKATLSAIDFVPGVYFIGTAFFFAFMHLWVGDLWEGYYRRNFIGEARKKPHIRMLLRAHKWSTRCIPETPPQSWQRRALIELLKSDAVYNFVTQTDVSTHRETSTNAQANKLRAGR
jgi:hypothetical protein